MGPRFKGWLPMIVTAVAFATAVFVQNRQTTALERELMLAHAQAREMSALAAANARLREAALSPEALAGLRSDREALGRLRAELDSLKASVQEQTQRDPAMEPWSSFPERSGDWRDVGCETPAAALQTLLWAAKAGNMEAFASALVFPIGERNVTKSLFDMVVPEKTRSRIPTAELLVAEHTIKGFGLESVTVAPLELDSPNDVVVRLDATARDTNGGDRTNRSVRVIITREPQGWRVVVPPYALEAAMKAASNE